MDWKDLLTGVALYLVLEGILPFLSPDGWRRSMTVIAGLPRRQLRIFGLISMLAGLVLLFVVRSGS
ncbi:MAG: DUF2065 domain-containing protein [Gammaproteobacteria bacterium]